MYPREIMPKCWSDVYCSQIFTNFSRTITVKQILALQCIIYTFQHTFTHGQRPLVKSLYRPRVFVRKHIVFCRANVENEARTNYAPMKTAQPQWITLKLLATFLCRIYILVEFQTNSWALPAVAHSRRNIIAGRQSSFWLQKHISKCELSMSW